MLSDDVKSYDTLPVLYLVGHVVETIRTIEARLGELNELCDEQKVKHEDVEARIEALVETKRCLRSTLKELQPGFFKNVC